LEPDGVFQGLGSDSSLDDGVGKSGRLLGGDGVLNLLLELFGVERRDGVDGEEGFEKLAVSAVKSSGKVWGVFDGMENGVNPLVGSPEGDCISSISVSWSSLWEKSVSLRSGKHFNTCPLN